MTHYDNWYVPSTNDLHLEWESEYDKMRYFLNTSFFDDENRFIKFFTDKSNYKLVRLPLDMDHKIHRRTFTSSIPELESMVSTYRSAARRKGVPTKLAEMIKSNQRLPTPIIMKRNGKTYVVGGNTRLDVCRILDVQPDPIVMYFDLDKPDTKNELDQYPL